MVSSNQWVIDHIYSLLQPLFSGCIFTLIKWWPEALVLSDSFYDFLSFIYFLSTFSKYLILMILFSVLTNQRHSEQQNGLPADSMSEVDKLFGTGSSETGYFYADH